MLERREAEDTVLRAEGVIFHAPQDGCLQDAADNIAREGNSQELRLGRSPTVVSFVSAPAMFAAKRSTSQSPTSET